MTNTKKRVFTGILLTIFLFIITLGFISVAFPKKEQGIAKADNVVTEYSFIASDMYNIECYRTNSSFTSLHTCLFSCSARFNGADSVIITPYFNWISTSGMNLTYNYYDYYKINHDAGNGVWPDDYVGYGVDGISLGYDNFYYLKTAYDSNDMDNGNYFTYITYISNGFNCNVYKIALFLTDESEGEITSTNPNYQFLCLRYYDVNDNYMSFYFLVPINYNFNSRIYYLTSSDNLTDNQLYNAGYQQGLIDNQQNVYNSGYSAGQITGYNSGYSAGVANANNYSFATLLGSVVDAPVNAFKSMFNFEILGVNLLDFLLGLFTISIIITVIKVIKGGR